MKKLLVTSMMLLLAIGVTANSYAAVVDQSLSSNISATVGGVFSLEFYTDTNVIGVDPIPFSTVNPTSAYNYPNGRAENDGKSDIGLVCTSNQGNTWYLKININPLSDLAGAFGCFMGQPTDRNSEVPYPGNASDGTRTYTDWFTVSSTAETVYTAGAGDENNTPFGTLATLNFKIDGTGLIPGTYTGTLTYTLSETP